MRRLLVLGLIIIIVATIYSCTSNKYDKLYPASSQALTCDTTNISFATDIVPILSTNCYSPGNGCHDVTGSAISGYDFTKYSVISSVALTGPLLLDINWGSGAQDMPMNGAKLSQCDINKFTRWINEGAPNN
jgi:hypothetical protein